MNETKRKIGFLFSGQGAQKPGMMRDLYQIPCVKQVFDTADRTLGRKISALCFDGTQEELNVTYNTQPCVLTADIAAFAAFEKYGVKPYAAAGFSLGEYAAVYAAGVIGLEELFPLIQRRADAMQKAVPIGEGGMMALIGTDRTNAEDVCKSAEGVLEAVNFNCPGQIVLSGNSEGLASARKLCRERKIRAIPLPVSAPFHSSLMRPAAEELEAVLGDMKLSDAQYPVYMNVDAQPTTDGDEIKRKLIRQTMSPVLWETTIRNMIDDGVDTFVEFGPGKTLSGFVKRICPTMEVFQIEDMETLKNAVAQLKGV